MDIKTDLFLMGKKAEFIRQKILSAKKGVYLRGDLITREVANLVSNFNLACACVDLSVSVKEIGISFFGPDCFKAQDLLYRIEAVLSVTNAVGELGADEAGTEEVQIMPPLGQEVGDDKREEYLGS